MIDFDGRIQKIIESTNCDRELAERWFKFTNYDLNKTISIVRSMVASKLADKDGINNIVDKANERLKNLSSDERLTKLRESFSQLLLKDAAEEEPTEENKQDWKFIERNPVLVFCTNESDYRFAVNFAGSNKIVNPAGSSVERADTSGNRNAYSYVYFADSDNCLTLDLYEDMLQVAKNIRKGQKVFFVTSDFKIFEITEKFIEETDAKVKIFAE